MDGETHYEKKSSYIWEMFINLLYTYIYRPTLMSDNEMMPQQVSLQFIHCTFGLFSLLFRIIEFKVFIIIFNFFLFNLYYIN